MQPLMTIYELTDIIRYIERRFRDERLLAPTIADLREFSERFDAQQPPQDEFHRNLWHLVRTEVNRRLADHT